MLLLKVVLIAKFKPYSFYAKFKDNSNFCVHICALSSACGQLGLRF
jgi:hypothetical protein